MFVIGTAGHVDHGKSTLIEAITGTHPDRLQEEQERQMSIVLGFDFIELPDGREVSVVDVPGHRDFIENMLSGIGGIDASIFVIAADEGVMPQTREHLAILDLLGVEWGVIAITKIDLVDDPEWLDLVELEIHELLEDTVFKDASIQRVSARTGEGIPELLEALAVTLEAKSPRPDLGRPRLSVDRAFLVAGFGTVVTGTLLDGSFQVGDEVVLLPKGISGRIRGLQSHHQEKKRVLPGSRIAINISGVDLDDIDRGDVVAWPGDYQSTRRLDVHYQHLSEQKKPLRHNLECKFFLGADESVVRVRLLGKQQLLPGENGWLQLELSDPVVAQRGDHYILRRPSPSETIGGGTVVEPHPSKRHKRFDDQIIHHLESLTSGNPKDIVQELLHRDGILLWETLLLRSSLDKGALQVSVDELIEDGFAQIIQSEGGRERWVSASAEWQSLKSAVIDQVLTYHQAYPLRAGMPREELKSQSKLSGRIFDLAISQLQANGQIIQRGPWVAAADHQITFSTHQKGQAGSLLDQFDQSPYMPPTVKECQTLVDEEVFNALVGLGELKMLTEEIVFTAETYEEMTGKLREFLNREGKITVAEARDLFQSSRRYILPFLESLDDAGVTVREGDHRRLKKGE